VFEKRHQKQALEAYESNLAAWQANHDSCAESLALAQTFAGSNSDTLLLKAGEAVFATVNGASLIEERSGQGHWQGGNTGISVPIAELHGHAIRAHVGATRGHYVQAPPVAKAIDQGAFVVTNQRAVFQGAHQTRECRFDKLIGYSHANGTTTFSVSNRQKATVIHYGPALEGWVGLRLELALAHYRQQVPQLVSQLEAVLADVDAHTPTAPDFSTS